MGIVYCVLVNARGFAGVDLNIDKLLLKNL